MRVCWRIATVRNDLAEFGAMSKSGEMLLRERERLHSSSEEECTLHSAPAQLSSRLSSSSASDSMHRTDGGGPLNDAAKDLSKIPAASLVAICRETCAGELGSATTESNRCSSFGPELVQ